MANEKKLKKTKAINMVSDSNSDDLNKDVLLEMKKSIRHLMNYFVFPSDNLKGAFDSANAAQQIENYINKYDRLLYSEITNYVLSLLQKKESTKLDNLITNLDNCFHYCMISENGIKNLTKKVVLKLWDHVNLVNNQYSTFYQEEDKLKKKLYPNLDGKIKKINSKQRYLENKVNKATKKYDDIISNMVSMISIFVGIAFVMFGGMTLLNDLFDFSNMKVVPITELLCLGSLIGIIMIAIIYAFMIFILKLTEKNIKGVSLLNGILISMLAVLTMICGCMFFEWKANRNEDIYNKQETNIQESIETEAEQNIKNDREQDEETTTDQQNINTE